MNTFASSLLIGMEHAAGNISLADDTGQPDLDISFSTEPLPFEEAIDFFKGKVSLTKEEWEDLEPKLRFRAFTVARLAEADHIEMLRGRLLHAIEKGEHFTETWKDVKAFTEEADQPFSARYFETVYRTNIQSTYNAGRLMQYQNNMPPAWELLFIEDGRTSDICRGLASIAGNGKALAASHSFWSTYGFPPYHFNCRTTFRAVYDYEIGRGMEIENVPMKQIRENFKPQEGFGGNPIEKESWWKITPAMLERADKYGVTADIIAQARDLDMQSYFPELLQDYDVMYKGKKGGYVQIAKTNKENKNKVEHNDNEIASAKRLADLGHKVYLLPRSDFASSPDMLIDNEIGEMKHIHTDTRRTIREHIRKGGDKQRARTLYIQIQSQKQKDRLLQIMKEEIENIPTQTLLLDFNGSIIKYGRNFFLK
ncbi:phage minor head protein [Treponema denticola]|nr:phage minor head protein [Treponema denticola]